MRLRLLLLLLLLAIAGPGAAQPPAALDDRQAQALYERTLHLVESSGVAIPELARAGAPLAENMRQTLDSLKFLGFRHAQLHYRYLTNLRAFLLLSDAVPKPVPFPGEAFKQLTELRQSLLAAEVFFEGQLERLMRDASNPDRDNVKRYAEANARLGPPSAARPRVVFLGDSITGLWPLNEYFPDRDFVNRGISGQITGQMLGRFQTDVADLNPAAVVLLAGTNDIARGVDIATIKNNVTMICDLAGSRNIKVILATLLPVSDYHLSANPMYERSKLRPPHLLRALNEWIAALAKQRGYAVADYYQALLDERGQLGSDLAEDGLHPNPKGYRLMAPVVLQAVAKSLSPVEPARRKRRLF
jgi:lysophospholipase L1-like esterase